MACVYAVLTVFLTIIVLSTADDSSSPERTFYDVLEANGLPMGLFPKGISDFSLDDAIGRFELHLQSSSPCDAKFETRVRYTRNITGTVGYGKIASLSGVSAQELFLWLPIKGIQVDIPSSGLIYFDVGVVFKQFSLSFFETPKDCNAVEDRDEAGANNVYLFNDQGRILENHRESLLMKHFSDGNQRAAS